jgi:hypothetical protein
MLHATSLQAHCATKKGASRSIDNEGNDAWRDAKSWRIFRSAAARVSGYFVTHLALAVETFQNSLRTIDSF